MWCKAFLAICFSAIFFSLSAEEVDTTTILKAADTFFARGEKADVSGRLKSRPSAAHLTISKAAFKNHYYIVNNENHGYVIISGDSNVQPILGYSDTGSFNNDSVPPAVQDWLNWKENEINYIVNNNIQPTEAVTSEWNDLISGNLTYAAAVSEPLLTTTWGQGRYYNDLCPYDANSGYSNSRVPVGCGATAMAQLMAYWKYPDVGSGSHSYIPSSHPEYGSQSASFGTTTYAWDQMSDYVNSTNNAVSTLMFHLGVSVNMDYGPDGSSSFISGANSIYTSLYTYFKYKNTLSNRNKSSYTSAAWNTLIKQELDNRRPVIYRGANSKNGGGHMFVCDGYNSAGFFHINWGWNGSYNGYYTFESLTPDGSDFNYYQYAITGIMPSELMLGVSSNVLSLQYASESFKTFNIASTTSWSISSSQSWLACSVTSGSGSCMVTVRALSSNLSGSVRNATITISAAGLQSKTISVTQQPYSTVLPNLISFKPSKWDDKIVVSNTKGSFTSTPLLNTDSVYVDINVGNSNNNNLACGPFYSKFYVDDVERMVFYIDGIQPGYYFYYNDIKLGKLSAGTHTLRVVVDYRDMVAELNETDNEYIKTFTVTPDPALAISEPEALQVITAPNPVTDILKVMKSGSSLKYFILTNSMGKICLEKTSAEEEVGLDLSGLSAGYYILRIKTDKGVITRKIVKI